jgi:hypothetical protein
MNKRITEFATRVASSNPELAYDLMRIAMEFPTEKALAKYLKTHPNADKSNHSVKKKEEKRESTPYVPPSKEYGDSGFKRNKHLTEGLGENPWDWDSGEVNKVHKKLNKMVDDLAEKAREPGSPGSGIGPRTQTTEQKELNEAVETLHKWKSYIRLHGRP